MVFKSLQVLDFLIPETEFGEIAGLYGYKCCRVLLIYGLFKLRGDWICHFEYLSKDLGILGKVFVSNDFVAVRQMAVQVQDESFHLLELLRKNLPFGVDLFFLKVPNVHFFCQPGRNCWNPVSYVLVIFKTHLAVELLGSALAFGILTDIELTLFPLAVALGSSIGPDVVYECLLHSLLFEFIIIILYLTSL